MMNAPLPCPTHHDNKHKKQKPLPAPTPPVTLRLMPDGSFRIYGVRYPNRASLTKALRAWRRQVDEWTGQTFFHSWDRKEADQYAAEHGLTILGPTTS